jgi:hypothetical protein
MDFVGAQALFAKLEDRVGKDLTAEVVEVQELAPPTQVFVVVDTAELVVVSGMG